jgi:hypothetical protein
MKFPTIFCTWEWIYTWWEYFGNNYELIILFVYKENELKGILPLAARSMVFHNGWLLGRILSYCGSMEVYPDHLDIIASKDEAQLCVKAIHYFLTSNYKDWDVVHLSHMSEGNTLSAWQNINKNNIMATVQETTVAPFIRLTGSFRDYLLTFSAKQRHNIERLRNRLYVKYGVELCYSDQSYDIQTAFKELFELHMARKQDKKINSTFSGQQLFNFHVHLAQRFRKNGWLRLVLLKKDGKAVAAGYGFAYGGRFSYYQSGFDLTWEKQSVGSIMLLELISNSCREELNEFDFLRGDEAYKKRWTRECRALMTITLYNNTILGLISKVTLYSRNLIKQQLRGIIKLVWKN